MILFFVITAGYTLFDHRRNVESLEELKVEPDDDKLRRCESNCLRRVTRTDSNRIAKITLN